MLIRVPTGRPFLTGLLFEILIVALIVWGLLTLIAGCASAPVSVATDTPQRAFAVYGTFVVMEEQGAALVQNPNVSAGLKSAITAADAKAKPAADALLTTLQAYESAQLALKSGTVSSTDAAAAGTALASAVASAAAAVEGLVSAVQSTPTSQVPQP